MKTKRRTRRSSFGAFLLLALPATSATVFAQPESNFVDLVRRSGFIFQGTVKAIGESTPTVRRGPSTAVVVVDRVLEALPPVWDLKGRDVTVRLREPHKMRPGQAATFFTYVYSTGATFGLEEVASLPPEDPRALVERIAAARATLADEALSKRLASARFVVVGILGEGKPTEAARNPESEHDPLWWSTPLRVESSLKGAATNDPIVVNVSHSDDVVWRDAPKPKAGFEGIFLLQSNPGPDRWSRVAGLFLVDPVDVQSKDQSARVQRLLRAMR